jgi:large subunit ribosomal protein L31
MAGFGRLFPHWHTETSSGSRPHTCGDPATDSQGEIVKKDIHPEYVETQVTCTCGATFTTRSTAKNGVIHADVCSQCHPFYTGKQKILDTGGRVARFEQRYGKKAAAK